MVRDDAQQGTDFSSLTVVKLKELCREKKLHVSGNKAALVERLSASSLSFSPLQQPTPVATPVQVEKPTPRQQQRQPRGRQV